MRSISSAKVLISFDILKSSPRPLHNTPSAASLSRFGLGHVRKHTPFALTLSSLHLWYSANSLPKKRCFFGERPFCKGLSPCLTTLSGCEKCMPWESATGGNTPLLPGCPLHRHRYPPHLWRVKRNSSPPSGQCLRACICPPWRRIAFRTMLSPSPEPPRSRVRPESMR